MELFIWGPNALQANTLNMQTVAMLTIVATRRFTIRDFWRTAYRPNDPTSHFDQLF